MNLKLVSPNGFLKNILHRGRRRQGMEEVMCLGSEFSDVFPSEHCNSGCSARLESAEEMVGGYLLIVEAEKNEIGNGKVEIAIREG